MRTRVVILPGALESEGQTPLFERPGNALKKLLARGSLAKVDSVSSSLPECQWLGLNPDAHDLSPGVFMVSALGVEPPERSVHFHLSLLSTDGNRVQIPQFLPDDKELRGILHEGGRLQTSRLKVVEGRGLDHGLVWEDGSIEMQCQPPRQAAENGLRASLPEGDGENMLRQFIDDSVNLLSELEANAIRVEEGDPPFNLLWPWGQGFRPGMPNLTVERGTSVQVESPSVRLAGLCRMVGYRHGDPWTTGAGTNLRFDDMAKSSLAVPYSLAVIPTIGELRSSELEEEALWLSQEFETRFLEPIVSESVDQPRRIVLIATQARGHGLVLDFRSDGPPTGTNVPFIGEAVEEKSLSNASLHQVVQEALTAR